MTGTRHTVWAIFLPHGPCRVQRRTPHHEGWQPMKSPDSLDQRVVDRVQDVLSERLVDHVEAHLRALVWEHVRRPSTRRVTARIVGRVLDRVMRDGDGAWPRRDLSAGAENG